MRLPPHTHTTIYPPHPFQVGRLWTSLADYFIRRGMFERARDVYEEGLQSVVTVRPGGAEGVGQGCGHARAGPAERILALGRGAHAVQR